MKETRKFDAEIGKVLHLMIHSLYTNKDIFLRELISNASDACDKLRYLSITEPQLLENDSDLKIKILIDKDKRNLIISDNGIGMSKDELIENLGTIARSGTQNFLANLTGDSKSDTQLIGQFGVGFYSAFMVANEITVISKKAGEPQAHLWNSSGEGEFTISDYNEEFSRGTRIILALKENEDQYLEKFRINHIITTYSDHISVPILVGEKEEDLTKVNTSSALWMRSKSEIKDEDYKEFYHHVAHQPDEPWMILHNKNEGSIEYTNLLFIPSIKPFDLFHPDRKRKIKLYVKKVFITDEGIDLVPSYLRFMRGIVDSEDLPLNISRETLQHNHVIDKIRKSITNKVLSELNKKKENEAESYLEFWNNFGAVLKEGLCESFENRENLLKVCLFRSATSGKLISLDDYISNMQEGQNDIYYLSGDDADKLLSSPQIEGFLKRNIDVLLFTDTVDDFWVNVEHSYKEKELKSITRSGIDLDNLPLKDEENKEEQKTSIENTDKLIEFVKTTLGDNIKEAKISHKLVSSPVCLTVAEGAMDIRMERFLVEQKQLKSTSAKILEINPNHPIITKLAKDLDAGNNADLNSDLIKLLYDQACIVEGEPVVNVGEFSKRMNDILAKII
ncbi:MAG: molecular chaperone HtpG [Alphaproteobacteria bacterium]